MQAAESLLREQDLESRLVEAQNQEANFAARSALLELSERQLEGCKAEAAACAVELADCKKSLVECNLTLDLYRAEGKYCGDKLACSSLLLDESQAHSEAASKNHGQQG